VKYYEHPELRREHAEKMLDWIKRNATWDVVAAKWKKLLYSILRPEKGLRIQKAGMGRKR